MKHALVLHLFYEDVALALLERIGRVGRSLDVFVTGPRPSPRLARALGRLDAEVTWVETDDAGFDVAPFLSALALLRDRHYAVFGKLHTKSEHGPYDRRWRDICYAALATPEARRRIVEVFARHPGLTAVGPRHLYLSAEVNRGENAENMLRLAEECFPDRVIPRDWGFFAGTMFWGRVDTFLPFLSLRNAAAEKLPPRRDGQPAHAIERLFGLAPLMAGGQLGLAEIAARSAIRIVPAAKPAVALPIEAALADAAHPSPRAALDRGERRSAVARNPLLHYITAAGRSAHDPNPLFSSAWYAARNEVGGSQTALGSFRSLKADAPAPGPRFDSRHYVASRPWLRRRQVNPLEHFLRTGAHELPRHDDSADWRLAGITGTSAMRRAILFEHLAAKERWNFAINIATPTNAASEWGDAAFAAAFARALRKHGHAATVHYRDKWQVYRDGEASPDVVVWLRGPAESEAAAHPGALNVLWIISHPDQVSIAEMESCDLVCVASESHAALLRSFLKTPVMILLQATDGDSFRIPPSPQAPRPPLFVGNTNGRDREIVRWAIEQQQEVEIYGSGWSSDRTIQLKGSRLDNRLLAQRYRAAAVVLNDHWPAMREFGIVSNRLFDVLGAGGVPVSDGFPAVRRTLGGAVVEATAADELPPAIAAAPARTAEERAATAAAIHRLHSFDRRVTVLDANIRRLADGEPLRREPRAAGPTVSVVLPAASAAASRRAFARLIAPLTHDILADVRLATKATEDTGSLDGDFVIAPLYAVEQLPAVERLVAARRRHATKLVIDCAIDVPRRGPLAKRLARIMAVADQVWVPSEAFAAALPAGIDAVLMRESLDPRLWRDFHRPRVLAPEPTLRFAVMQPDVPPARLAALVDQLGRLRKTVPLTLALGRDPGFALPDWVETVDLAASETVYPRYADALRHTARYDVGICLIKDGSAATAAVAERTFLEQSALGMVSVIVGGEIASDIARRGLVLSATVMDLAEILADPMPLRAIQVAAAAYAWDERPTAGIARQMRSLLIP